MSRTFGTVSIGLRAPIIREGDNLVNVVADTVRSAMENDGLKPRDRDIIAMTEAIVARAQGNYVTIDQIAADVRAKLGGETVAVIFPILSRNRFSICLRGIATVPRTSESTATAFTPSIICSISVSSGTSFPCRTPIRFACLT